MLVAERPLAFSPKIATNASVKAPVETPLRYSAGIRASMLGTRRRYFGNRALVNVWPSRCRTRG
jgi:hypothetical protein